MPLMPLRHSSHVIRVFHNRSVACCPSSLTSHCPPYADALMSLAASFADSCPPLFISAATLYYYTVFFFFAVIFSFPLSRRPEPPGRTDSKHADQHVPVSPGIRHHGAAPTPARSIRHCCHLLRLYFARHAARPECARYGRRPFAATSAAMPAIVVLLLAVARDPPRRF